MKKSTRLLAVFSAMLTLTAFSGCSTQETSSPETVSSNLSESTSNNLESTSNNLNETGLPILNEPEEFEIYIGQMSTMKKANEKDCAIKAEQETNVIINWVEVPTASWGEKVNILFASNSLPDAFCSSGVDVATYGDQLAPLNDLIDQYAPTTKAFFEERPDYPPALSDADGIIRGLPIGDEYMGNTMDSQMWINQGWLDNLGLSVPTTIDEFHEVLRAFQTQDPNGNGEADEIPFVFRNVWDWGTGIKDFFGMFGVVENGDHCFIDPQDGKTVIFSPAQDGYRDCLEFLHQLYSEGLIGTDCFTISDEQYNAQNAGGKDLIGVCYTYNPTGNVLGNPNLTFTHVPAMKGPDGDQMVSMGNLTRSPGFQITTACENPAALVRWYDYVNTGMENFVDWRFGQEGIAWHWEEDDNGEQVMALDIYRWTDEEWEEMGYDNSPAYNGAESFGSWSPVLKYDEKESAMIDTSGRIDYKMLASKENLPYAAKSLPSGIYTQENAEQRNLIKTDMNNYLMRFIADSIINGLDDAKWETHLTELEKLKADEYQKLCQEFTDAVQNRN